MFLHARLNESWFDKLLFPYYSEVKKKVKVELFPKQMIICIKLQHKKGNKWCNLENRILVLNRVTGFAGFQPVLAVLVTSGFQLKPDSAT